MTPRPPRSTLFPYTTLFRSTVTLRNSGRVVPVTSPTLATPAQKIGASLTLTINAGNTIIDVGNADDKDVIIKDPTTFTNKDRKSTRLNSSHPSISYAVFCLK